MLSGSISGTIIDSNSISPIKGAKVTLSNFSSNTNSQGEFKLNISYESGSTPPLLINSPNYKFVEYIPFDNAGNIKTNILIKLEPTSVSLAKDKSSTLSFNEKQINGLTKGKKDSQYFKNKKIIDTILSISSKLSPFILTLIAEFGVTGVNDKISKGKATLDNLSSQVSCPTNEQLVNIINRKNKVTKQLNNSLKIIELASTGIKGNEGLITSFAAIYTFLKFYPVPSAVGGVGVPIFVINNIQDLKEYIKDNLSKFSNTNQNSSSLVALLEGTLLTSIEQLSLLDQLTQHCAPDSTQTQQVLSAELTALTTQQSQQQSPVITNVNGFEMGVETEATTNTLKRRRAIARNKQGVIMLKGEWSFSSIDQILIDELTFYIQQNNLKAE